ncbi:MAG: cytochrome c oxidase accessory protein CcoG [Bacteroidota bacterium]
MSPSSHPKPASLPEMDHEAFRDTIATVDSAGKRVWVHPKKPQGPFHRRRVWVTIFLLGLFFINPFIEINGRPWLLFNLLERKFILFGLAFWPQDFHLLALSLITFFVFIVLFTVVFGRLWCGWACPQTLFMEMVFRKIEYLIDGDRPKQLKLARQPWNTEKIWKRSLKWGIFLLISFVIGNWAMMYIVSKDVLMQMVIEGPGAHPNLFGGVVAFTGIFFFVFAYLREQACIAICPYGRLQGVLLGKDSLTVAYDYIRGEPRGRIRKNQERKTGDCIACGLCVQVCPAGIDIKNGTQMECVNCTACMDVCDGVMDKVGFDRGLIRIASQNQIERGEGFRFTPRVLAYSAVLVVLMAITGFSIANRADVEATILRTSGTMTQTTEDGYLSNLYNFNIINKTMDEFPIQLRVVKPEGARLRRVGDGKQVMPAQGIVRGAFFIDLPPEKVQSRKLKVELEVYTEIEGEAMRLDYIKTGFLGPLVLPK